jgi:hypothetical protein
MSLDSNALLDQSELYKFPRAGEVSSIYGHLYLEAGNITECFVVGKIAGQTAAQEPPWD